MSIIRHIQHDIWWTWKYDRNRCFWWLVNTIVVIFAVYAALCVVESLKRQP
jgi:hypothetical protein